MKLHRCINCGKNIAYWRLFIFKSNCPHCNEKFKLEYRNPIVSYSLLGIAIWLFPYANDFFGQYFGEEYRRLGVYSIAFLLLITAPLGFKIVKSDEVEKGPK